MTFSAKSTAREALLRAIVAKLHDAGFEFSPATMTQSEFFVAVLTGLAVSNVSQLTSSQDEILARLLNRLTGTSVSPLTTQLGDILAGIANASIDGGGGGDGGGSFFGLEDSSGAFLLEGSGHISLEA